MSFLWTPGSTLVGEDQVIFDDFKQSIDKATNDFLIRPDWDANLSVVELVNNCRKPDVLYEVMSLFRKKLASSTPKIVVLTLRLLEALVNNCGSKWHQLMNDPKICNDIAHVARKYIRRPGSDNREVADVVLDLVQGWGEAFLPKRKQYQNIVETYFTLRKEGLPFKTNQQFDPNRMQIFGSPPPSTGASYNRDNTDAILAATLQSQLELEREREIAAHQQAAYQSYGVGAGRGASAAPEYPPRGSPADPYFAHRQQRSSPPTQNYDHQGEIAPRDQYNPTATQVVEALSTSISLLRDMIIASTQLDEIKYNEFADEIVDQMKESQRRVDAAIETAMTDEKLLERLFELNDQSQLVLQVYNDVKSGKVGLVQGQKALQKNAGAATPAATAAATGYSPGHHQQNSDLIDYNALIAEAEEAERQRQYAQQQHYQPHQHHPPQQQAYYSSPRDSPSQQARKQHPPQQQQQQQQARRIAPPPSAHGPHRQDSTGGDVVVAAKDPFAPDALDALFGSSPPPRAPPSSPPKANKAAAGVNRQESNDAGDVIVAAKDPFTPDALDALFDNKSKPAPIPTPGTKYDPFAPAALDALFDGPPSNQQQRSRQVSKDESHQARSSPGKPNPATGQRNPFSPEALDALFDTPKQPTAHHQAPPQGYYNQPPPQMGYNQAPPPAGYYGQAPPPGYYPGYPPQGYPPQQQGYAQQQPHAGYAQGATGYAPGATGYGQSAPQGYANYPPQPGYEQQPPPSQQQQQQRHK